MAVECAATRDLLPGYLGDELPIDQLDGVRAHLQECQMCRREAASYLQAEKALRSAAVAAAASSDVDDGDLHAAIMQRIEREQEREHDVSWSQRLMLVAAAVLLAAFGFWLAGETQPESIWEREPVSPVAGQATAYPNGTYPNGMFSVVPYVGPPVDLRPVGLDEEGGGAENGIGPGMLGRRNRADLLDLVQPDFVLRRGR